MQTRALICVRIALHRDGNSLIFKEGDTADAKLLERCASIDLTGGGTVCVSTVPGSLSNQFEVLVPGAKAKVLRVPGAPAKTSRDVPKTHAHKCTLHLNGTSRTTAMALCAACAFCALCVGLLVPSSRFQLGTGSWPSMAEE